MQQISTMMTSFAPPEKSKLTKRGNKKVVKKKSTGNNNEHTFEEWNSLGGRDWWKI